MHVVYEGHDLSHTPLLVLLDVQSPWKGSRVIDARPHEAGPCFHTKLDCLLYMRALEKRKGEQDVEIATYASGHRLRRLDDEIATLEALVDSLTPSQEEIP